MGAEYQEIKPEDIVNKTEGSSDTLEVSGEAVEAKAESALMTAEEFILEFEKKAEKEIHPDIKQKFIVLAGEVKRAYEEFKKIKKTLEKAEKDDNSEDGNEDEEPEPKLGKKWNKLITEAIEKYHEDLHEKGEFGMDVSSAEREKAIKMVAFDLLMKQNEKNIAKERQEKFKETTVGQLWDQTKKIWKGFTSKEKKGDKEEQEQSSEKTPAQLKKEKIDKKNSLKAIALEEGMTGLQINSVAYLANITNPTGMAIHIATRIGTVGFFKKASDALIKKVTSTETSQRLMNSFITDESGAKLPQEALASKIQKIKYAAIAAGTAVVFATAGMYSGITAGVTLYTREIVNNLYKNKIMEREGKRDKHKALAVNTENIEDFVAYLKKVDTELKIMTKKIVDLDYERKMVKDTLTVIGGVATLGSMQQLDGFFSHLWSSRRIATNPTDAFIDEVKNVYKNADI